MILRTSLSCEIWHPCEKRTAKLSQPYGGRRLVANRAILNRTYNVLSSCGSLRVPGEFKMKQQSKAWFTTTRCVLLRGLCGQKSPHFIALRTVKARISPEIWARRSAWSHALDNWKRRPPFLLSEGFSTRSQIPVWKHTIHLFYTVSIVTETALLDFLLWVLCYFCLPMNHIVVSLWKLKLPWFECRHFLNYHLAFR